MTGYDIDGPGFEFGEGTEIFLFTYVKRPEREAGHLLVSSDEVNTLRTGSFKLFKRPFPGFLTILTL